MKHYGELIEPYGAFNSELSDIGIQKKVLHGYHAAKFSCTNLQLSLNTMQQNSNEMQTAVRKLKHVFTISFLSKACK